MLFAVRWILGKLVDLCKRRLKPRSLVESLITVLRGEPEDHLHQVHNASNPTGPDKTIQEFHKTVRTTEVDQQLQGIRPADILTPPTIKYELEERATVSNLLFEPLDGLTENQILQVRIDLIETMCGFA